MPRTKHESANLVFLLLIVFAIYRADFLRSIKSNGWPFRGIVIVALVRLAEMAVDRPDLVWCAYITFLHFRRGFLSLVGVMNWATRRILAWRRPNHHACRLLR